MLTRVFPGKVSMTASLHPCTDVVQLAVLTALLVIMGAMQFCHHIAIFAIFNEAGMLY